MKIKVLGSGCPTCKKLHEHTIEAVKNLKIDTEVQYITDIQKIIEMGVMSSPVLVVDEEPVVSGRVPSVKEIEEIIARYYKDK